MANVTGSFNAAGQSNPFAPDMKGRDPHSGVFNIALTGAGAGTVALERSFDRGTTWCGIFAGGTQLYVWTYSGTNLSETAEETEEQVIYRLNCTAYTSGTISYRLSQ